MGPVPGKEVRQRPVRLRTQAGRHQDRRRRGHDRGRGLARARRRFGGARWLRGVVLDATRRAGKRVGFTCLCTRDGRIRPRRGRHHIRDCGLGEDEDDIICNPGRGPRRDRLGGRDRDCAGARLRGLPAGGLAGGKRRRRGNGLSGRERRQGREGRGLAVLRRGSAARAGNAGAGLRQECRQDEVCFQRARPSARERAAQGPGQPPQSGRC